MTHEDVAEMLRGVGLPFAYDHFDEAVTPGHPPFICFLYADRDDFSADDSNYASVAALRIELYTDNVEFELESRLETALTAADLVFTRDQSYISQERMYLTTYNTEVLLTNG